LPRATARPSMGAADHGGVRVPIRIVLADDHVSFRTSLRALLDCEPEMRVVAEFGDGAALVDAFREGRFRPPPDLIVMDVAMPKVGGIEATRRIAALEPGIRILAASMHDDANFVRGMIDAGAHGYALKGESLQELLRAIREVAAGGTYFSASIAGVATARIARGAPAG